MYSIRMYMLFNHIFYLVHIICTYIFCESWQVSIGNYFSERLNAHRVIRKLRLKCNSPLVIHYVYQVVDFGRCRVRLCGERNCYCVADLEQQICTGRIHKTSGLYPVCQVDLQQCQTVCELSKRTVTVASKLC